MRRLIIAHKVRYFLRVPIESQQFSIEVNTHARDENLPIFFFDGN